MANQQEAIVIVSMTMLPKFAQLLPTTPEFPQPPQLLTASTKFPRLLATSLKDSRHMTPKSFAEASSCGVWISLNKEQEVQQGLGVPYQVEDLRRFWREVSRDWNAFNSNADNRHMPAITLIDARVQVGYLKYDHPQSLHYPDAPGAARKHLAPVYMRISTTTRDQMFTTIWKGGDRKFTNPSHAELNGGTIARCIDTVIQRVDRNTKERTKAYNIRLIINTARCGVMRFAQTGTGHGAYLPPETERPVLLETAFVRDRARQMVSNSGAGPVP
ncbi:hypothetical protein NOF04DRAFT_1378572 [Fusarium oxysporum II5]|nr:hypothetical protein NOF04DRAFT_1378572 [Fusarium oxysporum II5]